MSEYTTPRRCLTCGEPRTPGRLWCDRESCREVILAMTTDEIDARKQEQIDEIMRSARLTSTYIHMTPREEEGLWDAVD